VTFPATRVSRQHGPTETALLGGAPDPLDQTGGRRIVLYAGKEPDHRGLTLTSAASPRLDKESLEPSRAGTGLSMKLQAKDCADGGRLNPRFPA
jgi:hypothetical protein